jgi:hypothetical protein
MTLLKGIRLAFAVLLPMACTPPREKEAGEDIRWDRALVVGSAARADITHNAVVAIVREEGSLCSGTAVRRSADGGTLYVLTAAHCCVDNHPGLKLRIGADYAAPSLVVPVESFQRHPCYNALSNDYDFCVAQVKDQGELNITPMPLAAAPDELRVGSPISFVGYGSTPATNTLRRKGEGRLIEVSPLTLAADQANGLGGICFGDSGGPSIVLQNGVEVVAGVGSFVAPTSLCNIVGVAGRVSFPGVRDEFLEKVFAGERATPRGLLIKRQGITPGATRDTYLASDEPNRNFGSHVDLLVGTPRNPAAIRRALVRFDLSGVPAGATVLTARVGFHNESRTGPGTIDVHRVTKDWDEASETWASFGEDGFDPTPVASAHNATAITLSTDEIWFDVTGLAVDWLNGKVADQGLLLRSPENEQTQLLSSEIGRGGERPWMHVCFLPKPPSP